MGIHTGYNHLVGGWYAEVYQYDEEQTLTTTVWESEIYPTEAEARIAAERFLETIK